MFDYVKKKEKKKIVFEIVLKQIDRQLQLFESFSTL